MNLNPSELFKLIKAQQADRPACVLTIYRWFFEKQQHHMVDVPLIDKIRHLEGDKFSFSLMQIYSKGKKPRYLRTDLMIAFPDALGEPMVLGGRVPYAMINHLDKVVGLPTYKADSNIEDDEAA